MKNLLFIAILISICFISKAQFIIQQSLGSKSTMITAKGGFKVDSVLQAPVFADTAAANLGTSPKFYPGNIIRVANDLWMRSNDATTWIKLNSTSTNIYNSNGTIQGTRLVDGNNKGLTFDSLAFSSWTTKVASGKYSTWDLQAPNNIFRTIGGGGTTVSEVSTIAGDPFSDGTTNGVSLRIDDGVKQSYYRQSERYIHLLSDSIKFVPVDGAGSSGNVWTNTGNGYGHWAAGGISSITADNGLTANTFTNVQLGGTLLHNTTINGDNKALTFDSLNSYFLTTTADAGNYINNFYLNNILEFYRQKNGTSVFNDVSIGDTSVALTSQDASGNYEQFNVNPTYTKLSTELSSKAGKFIIKNVESDLTTSSYGHIAVWDNDTLKSASAPSSVNIYNADGRQTANRHDTIGGHSLTFMLDNTGSSIFALDASGTDKYMSAALVGVNPGNYTDYESDTAGASLFVSDDATATQNGYAFVKERSQLFYNQSGIPASVDITKNRVTSNADSTYLDGSLYGSTLISNAGTLTLASKTSYIFNGTTTTWTLPTVTGNAGLIYHIKNRGSGAITLNSDSGNTLYTTSATNTLNIAAGEGYVLVCDGTYFNVVSKY